LRKVETETISGTGVESKQIVNCVLTKEGLWV